MSFTINAQTRACHDCNVKHRGQGEGRWEKETQKKKPIVMKCFVELVELVQRMCGPCKNVTHRVSYRWIKQPSIFDVIIEQIRLSFLNSIDVLVKCDDLAMGHKTRASRKIVEGTSLRFAAFYRLCIIRYSSFRIAENESKKKRTVKYTTYYVYTWTKAITFFRDQNND